MIRAPRIEIPSLARARTLASALLAAGALCGVAHVDGARAQATDSTAEAEAPVGAAKDGGVRATGVRRSGVGGSGVGGGDAVREAVRELEDAESRLRGGIYQFPLAEGNTTAPARSGVGGAAHTGSDTGAETGSATRLGKETKEKDDATKVRAPGEPMGIDILPSEEAGEDPSRALGEIASRLAAIQSRAADARARILKLQDEMAARLDDVGLARVTLLVPAPEALDASGSLGSPGPLGSPGTPGAEGARWPLAVHELSASLDGIPLVSRLQPRRIERDARFHLYEGPLPAGEYQLRVRVVVGLLAAGWPSQLGQGRWLVERSLTFRHEPSRSKGPTEAFVVLSPEKGNTRPTLSLRTSEAKR